MNAKQLALSTGARIDRAVAFLDGSLQSIKRLFFFDPSPHSPVNTLDVNAKGAAGSANTLVVNTFNGYRDQNSFVFLTLLLFRRPSDVSGFIVAIFIQPVNGVPSTRHGADIGKESRKVFNPWLKNRNSPPAIRIPLANFGVEAPLLHPRPAPIFWAARVPSSVSMLSNFFHGFVHKRAAKRCNPLFCEATAGFRLPISEFSR